MFIIFFLFLLFLNELSDVVISSGLTALE